MYRRRLCLLLYDLKFGGDRMKLNNKGITLVELIVSISLISIVLMFLFRLLVDIRYSENSTDFNRANQQTRAIILKTIQEDFLERKVVGLVDWSSNEGESIVEFLYADHTRGRLSVTTDNLTYTNNKGTEKWNLERETEGTRFGINCIKYSTNIFSHPNSQFFYIKFTIPVIANKKRKNYLDDLEFFYLGERKDISFPNQIPNSYHLGYVYNANQCG